MALTLITPASSFPVSRDEAKANCRIDHADDDTLVDALIAAATAAVERETGRAFSGQTWELTLDVFPSDEITIPLGPVNSVASVIYQDADGAEVTLDEAEYLLDSASNDGRLIAVSAWPTAGEYPNAVRVRFEVGQVCPVDVKQAILLLIGLWYERREDASDLESKPITYGVRELLTRHRRMFV